MTRLHESVLVDADRVRERVPEVRVGAGPDAADDGGDATLARRFGEHFPALHAAFSAVYGDRDDALEALVTLVERAVGSWRERPATMRTLDAARETDPLWFTDHRMLGAVCYVDRWAGSLAGLRERIGYLRDLGVTYLHLMPPFAGPAGDDDGGYAISSYRELDPAVGTMSELAGLARELREAGISLVLDFVFNHTSDEHLWARRAVAGEVVDGVDYGDFYRIYPDRTMPDAFERTTREIFPDDHPGSFVQLPDGRWVWATFYRFQWDLNYANPDVLVAMAGEMLFLANQGVEMLRMDAVAFIWKQLGTTCESLPQAHQILRVYNAVLRMAAPAVQFKSEAIVHPDEVVAYIDPRECQLSYNPLQMALTWEALATRDASMLNQALARRHALPPGTSWVTYVRSHDDIGWTFDDVDAADLGIDGYGHRRFLNDFYVGRFPGSFARGVPFQENPRTGDARVAGTTASLAGVEAGDPGGVDRVVLAHALAMSSGGVPLIYLGDEVAQLNDPSYLRREAEAGDSRWVHRPFRPEAAYAARGDLATPSGQVFTRLRRLIEVRKATPELGGNTLLLFETHLRSVVAFLRPGERASDAQVLVIANVADHPVAVDGARFAGLEAVAHDLVGGGQVRLLGGVALEPHAVLWLRVVPA